jgi:hypothetical protein
MATSADRAGQGLAEPLRVLLVGFSELSMRLTLASLDEAALEGTAASSVPAALDRVRGKRFDALVVALDELGAAAPHVVRAFVERCPAAPTLGGGENLHGAGVDVVVPRPSGGGRLVQALRDALA